MELNKDKGEPKSSPITNIISSGSRDFDLTTSEIKLSAQERNLVFDSTYEQLVKEREIQDPKIQSNNERRSNIIALMDNDSADPQQHSFNQEQLESIHEDLRRFEIHHPQLSEQVQTLQKKVKFEQHTNIEFTKDEENLIKSALIDKTNPEQPFKTNPKIDIQRKEILQALNLGHGHENTNYKMTNRTWGLINNDLHHYGLKHENAEDSSLSLRDKISQKVDPEKYFKDKLDQADKEWNEITSHQDGNYPDGFNPDNYGLGNEDRSSNTKPIQPTTTKKDTNLGIT